MSRELCVVGLVYFELDVTLAVGALTSTAAGQEAFVAQLPARLGGALNTASVARALGCDVTLCHPLGGGVTDRAVAAVVADLSIEARTWPAVDDPAVSLVVRSNSDRSFVSAADLNVLAYCPELPAAPWIHVPGLHEAELLAPQLCTARERGSRVSVSGSWVPSLFERLSAAVHTTPPVTGWDLLLLNAKEASSIVENREQWPRLRALAHEVIVTEGAQGATLFGPSGRLKVDARPTKVVDATGAGDAFAAGFLAARVRGADDRVALELGAAAAAEVLAMAGGVVLQHARFKELGGSRAK